MNVLVCIKPDITGEALGPFEALALEAGLKLKDQDPSVTLDVIAAGPPEWEAVLRRALGMGADNGYHVLLPGRGECDGMVPASSIAKMMARAMAQPDIAPAYDLILTGVMSQDLMAGQTGPMMAEYLNAALATAVIHLWACDAGLRAEREWEGGRREDLELPLPALVTIQAGGYVPRYPNLSNMLRAKSLPIHQIRLADLGDIRPNEVFWGTIVPENTRAGKTVTGSVDVQAAALKSFLKEKAVI